MGLVGFLGVSYPRYPLLHPTYFLMPPITLLMVEHIRMRPDR